MQVVKRDGRVMEFCKDRIVEAIIKAMQQTPEGVDRDLAEKINESYNPLQSWINRDRLPNAEQAVTIADALNTSVEFLVTGKSSNKKNDHSKTIKLLEEAIENLQREI